MSKDVERACNALNINMPTVYPGVSQLVKRFTILYHRYKIGRPTNAAKCRTFFWMSICVLIFYIYAIKNDWVESSSWNIRLLVRLSYWLWTSGHACWHEVIGVHEGREPCRWSRIVIFTTYCPNTSQSNHLLLVQVLMVDLFRGCRTLTRWWSVWSFQISATLHYFWICY